MKILYFIEKFGNKLPDPSFLFVIGTFLIFILSAIISNTQYSVLDPSEAERLLGRKMTPWREALKKFLKDMPR